MTQPRGGVRPGAWPVADGVYRFCLWAPDAQTVQLRLEASEQAMQRDAQGCFVVDAQVPPGQRYHYVVDGEAVPDPASRWQPDGVHGPSVVVDDAFAWRHVQWRGRPWHEAVIVELHLGASGGIDAVIGQLHALAALGVTAIELMPIAQPPGTRNWGYDGVFPYAPAASLATPDQLRELVDAAHGLGLMVLLDVVYNHFGPDGNLLGRYARGFFREGAPTPWGDAIDFEQPMVQRFFIDNALMWLRDYRFDGLRLDAVQAIVPTTFLHTLREAILAGVDADRHVHLVLENERNQASLLDAGFTAQWNDDFHNALHVLATGEVDGYYADFAQEPARHLARVLGEGFAWQGEQSPRGVRRGERSVGQPPQRFVVFAQNHDQIGNRAQGERLIRLVGADLTRACVALTALTPMIPLFFMGELWGERRPFLFFTDHAPPLDEAVREGRRREFAQFPAYADAQARAAIPDPNALETFRASCAPWPPADDADAQDWLQWSARLLALRGHWLLPRIADARALGGTVLSPQAVQAGWQLADGQWWIAFNAGREAVPVQLPSGLDLYAVNGGIVEDRLQPLACAVRWIDAHA